MYVYDVCMMCVLRWSGWTWTRTGVRLIAYIPISRQSYLTVSGLVSVSFFKLDSIPIVSNHHPLYYYVLCCNLSLVTCNLQYSTSDEYHTTFTINQPSTNRLNIIHPSPCVEDLGLYPHLHLQHGIVPPLSLLEMIEVG